MTTKTNKYISFYISGFGVLCFAVLGAIVGYFLQDKSVYLKPLGDIFMQLVKMLIVPIIFFSILSSIVKLNETKKAGKISFYGIMYFTVTSFIAVAFGMLVMYFFTSMFSAEAFPPDFLNAEELYGKNIESQKLIGFWDFIIGVIPSNPFYAIVSGNIMQIIVFASFLGVAITYVKHSYKSSVLSGIALLDSVFLWMIARVIYISPIAVFSLTAYATGTLGLSLIGMMLKLFTLYGLATIVYMYGFVGLLIVFFSRLSYFKFFKEIVPLQVISFTTSSSLASLPINIKTAEKLGLSKNIANFILPIGATVNMSGNAIFYGLVTVFFAYMFNVPLDVQAYIAIAVTSVVVSVGSSGVPGPTLGIVAVFIAANIPLVALPLLFAVDRFFDMFRTLMNVVGDTAGVAILDKYFNKR